MQKRKLGNTGVEVPAIMLGGNVFGWTVNETDSFRLLDAAFDRGLSFIDTADVYAIWLPAHTGGESETILGKWLARSGKRNQVTIATKLGMDMGGGKQGMSEVHRGCSRGFSAPAPDRPHRSLSIAQRRRQDAIGRNSRRLRSSSSKQGKVRFIGASNYSGARLREALENRQAE